MFANNLLLVAQLFFLIFHYCSSNLILNVSSANNIASSTTNHVFTLYGLGDEIFPNMYIQIPYDAMWDLSSATTKDTGDYCEITGCSMPAVTTSIVSNVVRINGLFPQYIDTNTIYTFRFTVKNIINPNKMYTQTLSMNFYLDDGTFLYQADKSINVEAPLMTCTGVPDIFTISSFATYTFNLAPILALPSNGYLTAKFPTQWGDSAQTNTFQSPTCSNTLGTITCTQQSSSLIKLNNLISSSSSSPFSFNISGIRNPGTTGLNQQLVLNYYNSGGELMSYCNINISGLTPKTLNSVTFDLTCNTSSQTKAVLNLTITEIPKLTDKMILTIPSEIQVTSLTKVFIYAGTDTIPLNKQVSIQQKTPTHSKISFFPFKTEMINYFRIQLYNLKCPSTTHETSNISIDIYRMGFVIMSWQCCNVTGSLPLFQSAGIFIEDSRMVQVTNYNFNIKINQSLGAGVSFVDFVFPPQYGLIVGTSYACLIQGLTVPTNTLCRVTSTNTLSLSLTSGNLSLILSTLTNPNTLSSLQLEITIFSITNPSSSQVSFDIYLSDSSHYHLQGITSVTYDLVAALISNVLVSSDSYQVNALTTYTFGINNTNALSSGATLRVVFPSQLNLNTPTCKINNVATSFTQSVNNSRQVLDITLPNIAIAQYGLSSYSIQVLSVVNPSSYELTDSFVFELLQSGTLLQGVYSGLSIAMNVSNSFSSLTFSLSNTTVNALAKYDITYSLPFSSMNSSKVYKLKFTFPTQYRVYTCTTCTGYGEFTITSDSGTVSFQSVRNPQKSIVSSVILAILQIDDYLSLETSKLIGSFTAVDQGFAVRFSNYVMGQPAVYEIIAQGVLKNVGKVIINVPVQVTIGASMTVVCLQCQLLSFTIVGHLLTVTITNVTSQNITLQLTNLTNPIIHPSSPFTLSTLTSDSITISQSSTVSNYFDIICAAQCATCDPLNTSRCLSCYQNALVTNKKYYDFEGETCKAACASTEYLSAITCYPCDSSCLTCTNESHICTSCSALLSLFNNQCVSNCPEYFYSSNNICFPCQSPCLTCTDQITCTHCIIGKLLITDGSCQDTCPTGQFNLSNICTQCPLNCTACTINGCTVCIGGNYLINGNCLSICPYGYFIDSTNTVCQTCRSPCKYCSGTSTNCTGCDTLSLNPYFYNNQCLTGCLPTFYADEFNTCQQCQAPCLNCNSPTNCTSCEGSYLFYASSNQCLLSCFVNTIQVGSQCQACQSPCLQCSQSIINCTSCIQGYFLDQVTHTCNSSCNSPYIALNRICRTCIEPCSVCISGQPYSCISCINGYYLMQDSCYSTCPITTFASNGYCLPCTSGCYQCVNTSTTCTACYPGTYLFGTSCMPNCPTTPTYYYEYQSQCISCQAPCKTCLASPVQCADCLLSTDYWNPVTLACSNTCVSPYFAVIQLGIRQCKQCQIPCKTCTTNYDICSSCYSSKFLYNQKCINQCPSGYFASDNNTCVLCPSLCSMCTVSKCLTCLSGSFLYKSSCYNTCPAQAPYEYGNYCRNCLKDNCLLCNQNNECIICMESHFIHNGSCLAQCPNGYEPDTLTNLSCIKSSQAALFQYFTEKQKQKTLIFPGTILLIFIIISAIIFEGNKFLSLYSLTSIPQTLTTIIFCYFYSMYSKEDLRIGFVIPTALVIVLAIIGIVVSNFFVIKSRKILMLDESFKKLYNYGSNQKRTNTVLVFSLINFKLQKLLFSGFLKVPFTSYQLKNKDLLSYLNWVNGVWIVLYNLPFIFIPIYVILVQKIYLTNNKIFFSALDCLIASLASLVSASFYLLKKQQLPQPYKKYIIQGVSTFSNPSLSEPNDYIGNQQQDVMHLYHSNSVEDIKQEAQQMKQVDFKSVYDPQDFQQPPKVPLKQLQSAIKKGKFRTKQKPKKKGKGKYKLDKLEIIDEQLNEEDQNIIKKQRRFKNSNKKPSLVNNYIYWKPPKTQKSRAQQAFKQNKKQIMQKIYEKQSQFDTITNNDIIFREPSDDEEDINDMKFSVEDISQDMNSHQESKRQLKPVRKRTQYNDLLNLNYAFRKHLQ